MVSLWSRILMGLAAYGASACGATVPIEAKLDSDTDTCLLSDDGTVRCWGPAIRVQPGERSDVGFAWPVVELPGPATDIAVGREHRCVVLEEGSIACWGRAGDYPRLGATFNVSPAPTVLIDVGTPFVQVDVAEYHSCGVTAAQELWCWGANIGLMLGRANPEPLGDDETVAEAGPVPLGESVTAVATGDRFTCALLEDGGVRCWGGNPIAGTHPTCTGDPLCGDIARCCPAFLPTELTNIALPGAAVQLVAGRRHACALLASEEVYCWGPEGAYGSYPVSQRVGDDEEPYTRGPVKLGRGPVSISAGAQHTCAVLAGGGLRCWGTNEYGELGQGHANFVGDDEAPSSSPLIELGEPVAYAAAGAGKTCALLGSGQVKCWGDPNTIGLTLADDRSSCFDERPNPDEGHGSPPTLTEFDCGNGPTCCFGDDEFPEALPPVPL